MCPHSETRRAAVTDSSVTAADRRTIVEMMAKGTYAGILLATTDLDNTFAAAGQRRRGRPGADRAAVRRSRFRGNLIHILELR